MKYEETLKIDLDRKDKTAIYTLAKRLALLYKETGIRMEDVKVFSTAHGFHVYIKIASPVRIDLLDLVFMQLLLGSDYRRELFNYRRILLNRKEGVRFLKINVLYQVKRQKDGSVTHEEETPLSEWAEQTIRERYDYWVRKYSE